MVSAPFDYECLLLVNYSICKTFTVEQKIVNSYCESFPLKCYLISVHETLSDEVAYIAS